MDIQARLHSESLIQAHKAFKSWDTTHYTTNKTTDLARKPFFRSNPCEILSRSIEILTVGGKSQRVPGNSLRLPHEAETAGDVPFSTCAFYFIFSCYALLHSAPHIQPISVPAPSTTLRDIARMEVRALGWYKHVRTTDEMFIFLVHVWRKSSSLRKVFPNVKALGITFSS